MKQKSKTWLDFVIIGAQKSGTTTLFKYLSEHPSIYMPPEKETAFFSYNDYFEKGWTWFLEGAYGNAPKEKLWGKASPQYMCFPQVPERMVQQIPQVKCIAVLRDPVARAYSHYRMSVRRGYEPCTFDECVRIQLTPRALIESRLHPTKVNSYVTWGEYGRVLAAYAQHFPRDQMLILFTKDLARHPKELLMRIYDFLAVEPFLPQTLGQEFHRGGTRPKLPIATKVLGAMPIHAMRKRVPLRLWRILGRLYFAFEQWNVIPGQVEAIPLTAQTQRALQAHFEGDAAELERVTAASPPWLPFPDLSG
jgi:hypothetical protein